MMQSQQLWTKNFILICLSSFFQFMTFYMLISTLPAFIIGNLDQSEREAGFAVSAFLVSSLFVRPFSGKWVDEFDRKKILLLSLGCYFLVSVFFLRTTSLWSVIVIRFLQGCAFGIANTVTATLAAELIPETRKGEGIGYFATCMSLAVALGPFLGLTIIAKADFTILFATVALLALLAVFTSNLICFHKTLPQAPLALKSAWRWQQYLEPSAAIGGLPSMCILFAFSGVATFISVYAQQLGIGEWARYFYVTYAVMVVLSRPIAGKVLDKLGASIVIYPAIILFALALLILSQVHSVAVFLAVGALVGLGFGSLFSSLQTIAVEAAPEQRKGMATATFFFLGDFGMGLGPSVLGVIVAWTNYSVMYMFSAAVVGLTVLVYYGIAGWSKCRRKEVKA